MCVLRWLPNLLSLTRIVLVPAWLALAVHQRDLALEGRTPHHVGVLLLLLVIGATDALDGLIARRFGLTSRLGAVLDAVADKLATFIAVGFLSLFAGPAFTAMPVWLFAALVLRDLLLGAGYLWILHGHREAPVEHRWHGRLATLVLFFTVAAACAQGPQLLVDAMSVVVLALVVPGTWDYLRSGVRRTSQR
ncbi:MAG: CDP-alcohol phosphatidyltransferase family protein [Myxococcaceae bacterium]